MLPAGRPAGHGRRAGRRSQLSPSRRRSTLLLFSSSFPLARSLSPPGAAAPIAAWASRKADKSCQILQSAFTLNRREVNSPPLSRCCFALPNCDSGIFSVAFCHQRRHVRGSAPMKEETATTLSALHKRQKGGSDSESDRRRLNDTVRISLRSPSLPSFLPSFVAPIGSLPNFTSLGHVGWVGGFFNIKCGKRLCRQTSLTPFSFLSAK